ncbi:MAG: TetR/AcrR family transcriptional regulator, partial [Eubacteriales bacterium]
MAEVEDKRIRRTKKLLRQALTRLMQQKDFQSITVTDVVREADINRGTFYAHYRDVYDLRDKIETGMIEDFRGMIAAIRPSETVTLKLVLSRLMDYLEENREIVTALI